MTSAKDILSLDLDATQRAAVLKQLGQAPEQREAKPAPTPRRGKMNKLEAAYANTHLEQLKRRGSIADYRFEAIAFRLAPRLLWTPDFMIVWAFPHTLIEFHECKGSWQAKNQRDARTRIKFAAAMFPCFKFVGVTRDGSYWDFEEFPNQQAVTTENREAK